MMLCADKQMLSSISAETKLFAGCHRSFVQHICTLCILTLVKEKKLQLLHAIRNTNIINTENYHKSITSHAMRQKNKILPPTMQGSNKNYHILSALSRCNHHGNLASTITARFQGTISLLDVSSIAYSKCQLHINSVGATEQGPLLHICTLGRKHKQTSITTTRTSSVHHITD